MSLLADFRDFRRQRRGQREAAAPIAFHPPTGRSGLIGGAQPSPDAVLREVLGWADIAVRAVAKRIMGLELEVVQRTRVGSGTVVDEVLDDHELALVLARWSPTHSRRQSLYLIARYLLELGGAYVLKVRGTRIPGIVNVPRVLELHPMHAARVRPIVEGGIITAYLATSGSGAEIPVPVEDVVYCWLPDPETLYTAEGSVAPQGQAIDASKYASAHLREHFQNDATPRVVIEAGADAKLPTPEQLTRWETGWSSAYSLGSKRRGLPAFLPTGFVAKVLDEHASSGSIVPILQHLRDQIFMALGVPRSVVGDVVDANRAAAETNQYVFDLYAVKPYADLIADALTTQLAQPLYGLELAVRFREFVPRDKEHDLRREDQDLRLKVRAVNEIRLERGEDPAPWGDLPVGSIADVPYTGEAPPPMLPEPDDGGDDPDVDPGGGDDAPRSRRRRVKHSALDDRATSGYVLSFNRALSRVFTAQQRRALEVVDELEPGRNARATVEDLVAALRRILAPSAWSRLFDATTGRVRNGIYTAQARRALAQVGGDPAAFHFAADVARELAAQEQTFRRLVSDTTVRELSPALFTAMQKSVEAGEPLEARVAAMRRAVSDVFDLRRARGLTIARTEVGTASEIAQLDGWNQSGVVDRKRWVNSRDDAVRDEHQIDGQTVPLASLFTLRDGVQARAPLDPSLPARDRINCRCRMVPLTRGEDDA